MKGGGPPDYAIVVPVFDESGAAPPLAREIAAAFAGTAFELIFVDDASRDDTRAQLAALKSEIPQLRVLGHRQNAGQSPLEVLACVGIFARISKRPYEKSALPLVCSIADV